MIKYPSNSTMPLAIELLKSGDFRKKESILNSEIYPLAVCHHIREFVLSYGPSTIHRLSKDINLSGLERFSTLGKYNAVFQPLLYNWNNDKRAYLEYLATNYTFGNSLSYDPESETFTAPKRSDKRFVIITMAPTFAYLIYNEVTIKSISEALGLHYYAFHASLRHYNVLPGNFVKMHRKTADQKSICSRPGCMNPKAAGNRFLCHKCWKGATDVDTEEYRLMTEMDF